MKVVRFKEAWSQDALPGLDIHLEAFDNSMHCADPRDRVYACLSLVGSLMLDGSCIRPDYSKSKTELFEDLHQSFLESGACERTWSIRSMVLQLQRALNLDELSHIVLRALNDADKLDLASPESNIP